MKQLVALAVAALVVQCEATPSRGRDAQARRHPELRRGGRAAELRLPRQHDVRHASTRRAALLDAAEVRRQRTIPSSIGDLAKSWTVAPDGLTYTFKLHEGVKFHDGSPLTSADVKATYERIANPPAGRRLRAQGPVRRHRRHRDARRRQPSSSSSRRSTRRMLLQLRLALQLHLQRRQAQREPALSRDRDHGLGRLQVRRAREGLALDGKRFDGYFRKGLPYLDGYKAYFVKSNAVVPGILGGQFDAEFRGRNPAERDQLLAKMKDQLIVQRGPLGRQPDGRSSTPSASPSTTSACARPCRWPSIAGAARASLVQDLDHQACRRHHAAGLRDGAAAGRARQAAGLRQGHRGLARRGQEAAARRPAPTTSSSSSSTATWPSPTRRPASSSIDQWRRIGVNVAARAVRDQALSGRRAVGGNFDVAIEFINDFTDDPTAQFSKLLTKKASPTGFSGHEDTKLDEMYEEQRRAIDPKERLRIVQRHGPLRHHDGLQRAAALVSAHHRQPQEDQELGLLAQPVHPAGPERGLARPVGWIELARTFGWASYCSDLGAAGPAELMGTVAGDRMPTGCTRRPPRRACRIAQGLGLRSVAAGRRRIALGMGGRLGPAEDIRPRVLHALDAALPGGMRDSAPIRPMSRSMRSSRLGERVHGTPRRQLLRKPRDDAPGRGQQAAELRNAACETVSRSDLFLRGARRLHRL